MIQQAPHLPLFPHPAQAPRQLLSVGGYVYGDLVRVALPDQPGQFAKGKIMAALPSFHKLIVLLDGSGRLVDIWPILYPDSIEKLKP